MVSSAVAAGEAGEPVLDELASRLALGVAATCVVLDPPLVVLAGEVSQAGGAALAEKVEHEVAAITLVNPKVVITGVESEPVLHGALQTALNAVRDEVFGSTPGDARRWRCCVVGWTRARACRDSSARRRHRNRVRPDQRDPQWQLPDPRPVLAGRAGRAVGRPGPERRRQDDPAQILAAARLHPSRGTAYVLGERLGRTDVNELRTRIGMSTGQFGERVPPTERVLDVVVTAAWSVVGRWREAYDRRTRRAPAGCSPSSAWARWSSASSARSPRASASAP